MAVHRAIAETPAPSAHSGGFMDLYERMVDDVHSSLTRRTDGRAAAEEMTWDVFVAGARLMYRSR